MKITAKDLIQDRKSEGQDCSPCCVIREDEQERKFYVSVPITEEAVKGLKIGESVKLVVEGKLAECRVRYCPEVEIQVSSSNLTQTSNVFEELAGEED